MSQKMKTYETAAAGSEAAAAAAPAGGGSQSSGRRRLLLLDFDGPVCPLHRNTTAGNATFKALGGKVCHERFGSDDGVVMGQCHVEVSNFGAFDCFFRVLKGYASTASVIIGSQRLAGKAQPPNSMLHMSYHEMVFALKQIFPTHVHAGALAMSDLMAKGVDPVELNNTKLPFLLACRKMKDFADLPSENICLMDDHAGYRDEVEEHGFHFIHCERQPQDECHRVQREDIQLVGPDGTVSENQNVDHLADGTPVVAKYPGRLYDVDQFFPAVVVRSKFNEREQKHIYIVQYVPERRTETGYLFDALRWLTAADDTALYERIRGCGSSYAQVVASLFSIHCDLAPQLSDIPRRGGARSAASHGTRSERAPSIEELAQGDVSCCAVM